MEQEDRDTLELQLVAAMAIDSDTYHMAISLGADKLLTGEHGRLCMSLFCKRTGEFDCGGLATHRRTLQAYNLISSEIFGVGTFRLKKMIGRLRWHHNLDRLVAAARVGDNPDDQLASVSHALIDLGSLADAESAKAEEIDAALDEIDKRATGGSIPLLHWPAHWMKKLEPMNRQELVIIGGRPGTGKSALMGQVAYDMAKLGQRVLFISLEMSRSQIWHRFAAYETGINRKSIDPLVPDRAIKYRVAFQKIAKDPCLTILECYSIAAIVSAISRHMVHGLDLVCVDYLQLITGDGKSSRLEQVSAITRALKLTAKDLRVPVMCASQLNRASEHRERPGLSSLRESGSIEQDADRVILLHNNEDGGFVELIQAKNRDGCPCLVNATFDGPTTSFKAHSI